MDLSYFVMFLFVQSLCCMGTCQLDETYSRSSELGKAARIDLLNVLKAALRHAKPLPSSQERKAALQFAKFLNSPHSNDYLEAFYATHSIDKANKFVSFLNGMLFGGDSSIPAWKAARVLVKMIHKKVKPQLIERIRLKLKSAADSRVTDSRTAAIVAPPKNTDDYVKLFTEPSYFNLYSTMKRLQENPYHTFDMRRKRGQQEVNVLIPVFVHLILRQLNGKLYNRLIHERYEYEAAEEMPAFRNLSDEAFRVLGKSVLPRYKFERRRDRQTHLFYSFGKSDDKRDGSKSYRPYQTFMLSM